MAVAMLKALRGGRSRASTQLLLPATARRTPRQEGIAALLPRPGPAAPLPPTLGAAAASASTYTFAAGVARPLLRTVPSPCPANPWRFQLMAGLRSSAHIWEKLAHAPPASPAISKECLASIQELENGIEHMEASIKQIDRMWWISVGLGLYTIVVVLPEQVSKFLELRKRNSEIASEIHASKESVEELNDEIARLPAELEDLEQQHAKAVPVIPSEVVPSSAIADV